MKLKNRNPPSIGVDILIIIVILFFPSCNKQGGIPKGKVRCPWDISIPVPISVNNISSRMKLGDTLIFNINVPFKNFNRSNNDSINLTIFSDLWGGMILKRVIHDSVVGFGQNYKGALENLKWFGSNNKFETRGDDFLLFGYKKEINQFTTTLYILPQQKGTFELVFFNSAFRDAFCANGLSHSFVNYSNSNFSYLIEEVLGRKLIGDDPYQFIPGNYILRVE
jgi:hypothetical protein